MKTHGWSSKRHFFVGLAGCGVLLGSAFLLLAPKSQVSRRPTQVAPQTRPIHLAAMDPVPELPAYLLTLCGPEVIARHGGKGRDGASPDWFLKAGRTLAEKGIVWPKPKLGLTDRILLSNVREHESQAMALLATDPAAAVAKMERLIRYEEDKFETRSWRALLTDSAVSRRGSPEPGLYRAMLEDIPGPYFEMIITETLEKHPDSELAAIAVAEALKREPKLRQTGLAAVIRNQLLAFAAREKAAIVLAGELNLSFATADVDGRDWTFEVGERLRDSSSGATSSYADTAPN